MFSLYQVYLAAGLASLLQVRVTELPSIILAEVLTDTEGSFGASMGGICIETKLISIVAEVHLYTYKH